MSQESSDLPVLKGRRLTIVSDAWLPQVNGVVLTLGQTTRVLNEKGLDTVVIGPDRFKTIPCPTYPEIRLAVNALWKLPRILDERAPTGVHIATEGPLGLAAKRYCKKKGITFSTSFHTKFPEYIHARTRLPVSITYGIMRRHHRDGVVCMVNTQTMKKDLEKMGFDNLGLWSRGVDLDLFHPRDKGFLDLPRPIFTYVGRVAIEKNIKAFLDLDLPGTKLVVGGGPQLEELKAAYQDAHFVGEKKGEALAQHYAASDVFVFPSRTDTFGNVMLEAMASGLPVAAYPVPGPADVIGNAPCGVLSEDLRAAALAALEIDPALPLDHAKQFTWERSTEQFIRNATPVIEQFPPSE